MATLKDKFFEIIHGSPVKISEIKTITEVEVTPQEDTKSKDTQSWYPYQNGSVYSNTGPVPIINGVFNGEKTQGALGNPMNLFMDHRALRFRAYEANATSDVIKIMTGKFFKWVVGKGLKMQSEPYVKILELEKVNQNIDEFKENVEPYWDLYANSKRADFAGMCNLHRNARKCKETSFLGGDCLVVLRLDDKNNVTSQVIDGQHVNTPFLENSLIQEATSRGNTIIHGIEINEKGQHIAFYVSKVNINAAKLGALNNTGEYERIEAIGEESGCLMAWMVYGSKHRIDHHRGIPEITAIIEKVQKLDRYTEATVATAEERAKVVYTVVHGKTSDGSNPFIDPIRNKAGSVPTDGVQASGVLAAKQMSVTENRQIHNLPPDSELKTVSSQGEINYEPFWKAVFVQACASIDMPPEVALQQYNSNYSASRAAINGWGFVVDIHRDNLVADFYQPIYDFWLYIHILKQKVNADGYLEAKRKGNCDVVEAYSATKFTGTNMPHIDPLKEMNAMRVALGKDDQTPLVSYEQATELLGFGDWDTNIAKIAAEKKVVEILIPTPEPETPEDNANSTEGKK
jgi:capsid protein